MRGGGLNPFVSLGDYTDKKFIINLQFAFSNILKEKLFISLVYAVLEFVEELVAERDMKVGIRVNPAIYKNSVNRCLIKS